MHGDSEDDAPGQPGHGTPHERRALWALRREQLDHYLRTGTMLPA